VTDGDEDNVTELIEITLMFARMELSLGAYDDAAVPRALDHIMEALKLLRDEKPPAPPKAAGRHKGLEKPGDFS
jgi:hypothetical protein